MADRNIVTQVGIEDLKFALSEVASNLQAHINASLTKAHGINLIQGYVDANGNDLTKYYDSNGDVIGDYFLRFVIENVIYFAPARFTTLPGQPETTGIVDTSPEGEFESQGGSAWITDYTSDQVQQAQAMNTDVLIPHTRQPAASTHGNLVVVQQTTFSSLGHTVGTHVIQMRIGNNVYNIPCVTTLGGPYQIPRIGSIPTNFSADIGSGDPNTVNIPITVPFNGGTKPVAYHWQYNKFGVWTDIEPSTNGSIQPPGWEEHLNYNWSDTSNPTFRVTEVKPGSNKTASVQFRCRVTNIALPDTGPTSGVITNVCTLTATDNTDNCFITTTVLAATGQPDDCDDLQTLRAFRESYLRPYAHGKALLKEYDHLGPKIVSEMHKDPNFRDLCSTLYTNYIAVALRQIREGNAGHALGTYVKMVRELQTKFSIK